MARVKPPVGKIRKMPDIQRHLDELTAIGKQCWLGVSVSRSDRNPNRSPDGGPMGDGSGTPMDRFVFMGDCFTSLDGEIAPDGTGFTVIYNHHLVGQYLEDGAFHGPAWEKGRFIPWALMKMALQYYVALANSPMRTYYQGWPPKALYPDSAKSTLDKQGQGFTPKTERQEPKVIGNVQIDGLYGASQFHLRTTRNFTPEERMMILWAIRIPMSGFVDAQTVAMRRILITTTCEAERRVQMVGAYVAAINAVLDGGWLWEVATELPHASKLGKLYTELTPKQRKEVDKGYKDMEGYKELRWWKAEQDPKEQKIIAHSIQRLLEQREKSRGT